MGVNALGDVISILKHAKVVQSKRTSDKVLVNSKSKPSTGPPSSSQQPPPLKAALPAKVKVTEVKKDKLAERLGPPEPKSFSLAKKVASPEVVKKPSVYDRLDQPKESKAAPIQRRFEDDFERKRRELIKRKLEEQKGPSINSPNTNVKRMKIVQSFADGTQIKRCIESLDDDAFEAGIMMRSRPKFQITDTKLRKPISPPPPSSSKQSDVKHRISLSSDRNEQQKSIKSRLSLPSNVKSTSVKQRLDTRFVSKTLSKKPKSVNI